jgi:hypothetical protein
VLLLLVRDCSRSIATIQVAAAPQAVCQHQTACSAAEFKSMADVFIEHPSMFTNVSALEAPARAMQAPFAFAPLPDIGLTSILY